MITIKKFVFCLFNYFLYVFCLLNLLDDLRFDFFLNLRFDFFLNLRLFVYLRFLHLLPPRAPWTATLGVTTL